MANESFNYLIKARADTQEIIKAMGDLDKFNATLQKTGAGVKATELIGKPMINMMEKQGQVVGKVTQKFKAGGDEIYRFSRPIGAVTRQMGDFEKAMRRVAIVVPIWFAFRQAFMTVVRTIQEGLRYWREFSAELMKAKGVIHLTTGDMNTAIKELTATIKNLSKETGVSMKEITSAFYRFGTVGLSVEDSMKGMEAAVKAALAMFGDADSYARTLALTYKLLGDTIDKTIPPQERMMSISAKLYTLWQKNAFEINDFTQSLMNFLPTANTMNLTLDQTLALLASVSTGAIQGARGGRLLRTSFAKLVENIDDVATSLGLLVDMRIEEPFDVFMRVLDEITTMAKSGDLERANEAIRKIFGGVRGGQVVRALIAMREVLKDNQKLLEQGRYAEVMEKFNQRTREVTDELSRQLTILDNLRRQVGESFVKAVVGGKSFEEALKAINIQMENLIEGVKIFWNVLTFPFSGVSRIIRGFANQWDRIANTANKISQALSLELPLDQYDDLIDKLKEVREEVEKTGATFFAVEIPETVFDNLDDYIRLLEEARKKKEELGWLPPKVEYTGEKFREPFKPQVPPPITISSETKAKLKELDQVVKYRQMELRGISESQIIEQKILDYIKARVESHKELSELVSAEEIYALAMEGHFQEILEKTKKRIIGEKEILEIKRMINKMDTDNLKIIQKYSDKLQSAFKEGLVEGGFEEAFTRLGEQIRTSMKEAMATGITKQLFDFTGLGQMFGQMGIILESGAMRHARLVDNAIVRAGSQHAKMIAQALSGQAITTGAGGFTGGGFLGAGGFGGIGGLGTWGGGAPIIFRGREYRQTPGGGLRLPTGAEKFWTRMGGLATMGMAGYAGYQQGGTLSGVMSGLGAGMMGMASGVFGAGASALASTFWLGPLGFALGLASMFGLFDKGKSWTRVETREATNQVTSRIDVTNRQLMMVNRNLVALRQEITYILPRSAYFSERDEFAINSQRGIIQ